MATADDRSDPTAPPVSPAPIIEAPPGRTPYEFTEAENSLIGRLASRMAFVGFFAIGVGVLVIASGVIHRHPVVIVSGAIYTVIGVWTERASRSFREVVDTKGEDIRHLMHALEDLRKLYSVKYWICFLALVLALWVLFLSDRLAGGAGR